jgi:hypothetical protein
MGLGCESMWCAVFSLSKEVEIADGGLSDVWIVECWEWVSYEGFGRRSCDSICEAVGGVTRNKISVVGETMA